MQGGNLDTDDEPFTFALMVETMVDFLEVSFHYILFLRSIYPQETFDQTKAYGVKVWQNRHPGIRAYIAGLLRAAGREMKRGILQRITFVVKSVPTNLPLERFIFDIDYMDLSIFPSEAEKDTSTLLRAPSRRQMKLNFQAFLTRLAALETGLTDNDPDEDLTYAVIITCNDHEPDLQPMIDYNSYEGNVKPSERQPPYHPPEGIAPWAPVTKADGLHPAQMQHRPPVLVEQDNDITGKGKGRALNENANMGETSDPTENGRNSTTTPEGLRPIRSLETGVIDINLMVQETIEKMNSFSGNKPQNGYMY